MRNVASNKYIPTLDMETFLIVRGNVPATTVGMAYYYTTFISLVPFRKKLSSQYRTKQNKVYQNKT